MAGTFAVELGVGVMLPEAEELGEGEPESETAGVFESPGAV